MGEKEEVKNLVAELSIECLWKVEVQEATGETRKHRVKVWKEAGKVHVLISGKEGL